MLLKNKIPLKYVFGKIKYELIFVTLYASFIGIWDKYYHMIDIAIPLSLPMVMGTVISLLLAFKSNQAYDRWWEARIVWGAIVNDSRTLIRQMLCFVDDPYESEHVKAFQDRFTNRQIAWCYSLGLTLRNQKPFDAIKKYLSPEEFEFVKKHNNVNNALLQLHARDLRYAMEEGLINRYQQIEIDETITKLCDSMGKCERIKNTVFPTTYSLYIHFSLFFFILLLPFGLLEILGILQIPMVMAIAAVFFLIEKMAIHLQDPFENKPTDTPVTTIARTIEVNLKQMLNETIPTDRLRQDDYYVL
jgi:ion channel-forming bestrophin family protein